MRTKVWKYGVTCIGVKKRCRKEDRHTQLKLKEFAAPDEELAKEVARKWVEDNMKTVRKVEATMTMFEIEKDSMGVQVEHWQPFTKEHNIRIALEV